MRTMGSKRSIVARVAPWVKLGNSCLDIFKLIGLVFVGTLGMCYVPNALDDARLRESVYSLIASNLESLTSYKYCAKRDVSIAGLSYLLRSKALDDEKGKQLLSNICYIILGDYEYSGNASGIMRALKDSGVEVDKHARFLSRSALVVDDVDIKGGLSLNAVNCCKGVVDDSARHYNINQIAMQIKAALVHYNRIVYVLKNRTSSVGESANHRHINALVEKLSLAVLFQNSVVVVDDTPKWIGECEVRFYHESDKNFSVVVLDIVNSVLKASEVEKGACGLKDYSLNIQGRIMPEGAVEVTVPMPAPLEPCECWCQHPPWNPEMLAQCGQR